jgi:hypothetical protein
MTSPVTVGTTTTVLAEINYKRNEIVLENTGNRTVYLKKVQPYSSMPIPSSTSYDYVLEAGGNNGNDDDKDNERNTKSMSVLKLKSISGFVAVTGSGTSTISVMQTVFI